MGSPGGVARSVLIIEDDDRIRRVVPTTLRREGLEVTEAGSGAEGLARLAERPYDIVLPPGRDESAGQHSSPASGCDGPRVACARRCTLLASCPVTPVTGYAEARRL